MSTATVHDHSAHIEKTQNVSIEDNVRLHYMDNIRALAMLMGIIFHAALAYGPLLQNMWLTSSPDNAIIFDVFSFFSHLFRMPVFFFISGFFAMMMIQKKGIKGFIKHRSIRVLLPLIIFLPLVAMGLLAAIDWSLNNTENPSPIMSFIKMMQDMPDAPQPLSTMHLWFLYYLYLFVLIVALLEKIGFFQLAIIQKCLSPVFIICVLPLLLVPALYTVIAPHPAPDKWYPEIWSFGFYGLFFLSGSMVFLKQEILNQLNPYKHILLLLSLIIYAYFYTQLPETFSPEMLMALAGGFQPESSHLPIALAEAYISVFMTLYCLIIGKQLLNKSNKWLKLIADSSYWIYLIHFPVLMMIQFYLLDIHISIWLKFLISCLLTFTIGLSSYVILVKHTPIGWLLNGRKRK